MKGRLIVIEGLDGSGKSTQEELLEKALASKGYPVKRIKLPNYSDDSSILVRQYLAGRFGDKPEDVNAYAASSFYAVDRVVSYGCYWKDDYLSGRLILADRYTTSNAYHQLTKLPREQWDEYLAWLEDFEYGRLALPKPDCVIYLDMPPEISQKLMTARYEGDESKKDIHEKNLDYLNKCRVTASYACDKLGWKRIICAKDGEPRTPEDISGEILETVLALIK